MVGLPDSEKNEDMFNRLDTIPACDRRTGERTSCHSIVRAMHTRRAVKIGLVLVEYEQACSTKLSRKTFNWRKYKSMLPKFFLYSDTSHTASYFRNFIYPLWCTGEQEET